MLVNYLHNNGAIAREWHYSSYQEYNITRQNLGNNKKYKYNYLNKLVNYIIKIREIFLYMLSYKSKQITL